MTFRNMLHIGRISDQHESPPNICRSTAPNLLRVGLFLTFGLEKTTKVYSERQWRIFKHSAMRLRYLVNDNPRVDKCLH